MTKRFWLSFCDPQRPVGRQFLGACIVDAENPIEAAKAAWRLRINPGGEVLAVPIDRAQWPIFEGSMNRLLSKDEAMAVGKEPSGG